MAHFVKMRLFISGCLSFEIQVFNLVLLELDLLLVVLYVGKKVGLTIDVYG